MADFALKLFEDRFAAGASESLPQANRVVYCADGAARLASAEAMAGLGPNSAFASPAALSVESTAGATLLRWELHRAAVSGGVIGGDKVTSRLVLEAPVALDATAEYLMRGDRVDFPVGGVAYRHRHQGPGIRRLLHGRIRIDTQGQSHEVAPGEAWFETGPDPVFAAASDREETAFARVMVLPLALKGRSSISYVDDADRDKPKTQRYQVFIDFPIQL